jgi:hypothetical protein
MKYYMLKGCFIKKKRRWMTDDRNQIHCCVFGKKQVGLLSLSMRIAPVGFEAGLNNAQKEKLDDNANRE